MKKIHKKLLTHKKEIDLLWGIPQVPDGDLKDKLTNMICVYSYILPSWVHTIYVHHSTDPDNFISCVSEPDYLTFRLHVSDTFLASDEKTWTDSIIHEFCHTYTTPQSDAIDVYLRVKLSEEDYKAVGIFISQHLERSTEELSMLIKKLEKDEEE